MNVKNRRFILILLVAIGLHDTFNIASHRISHINHTVWLMADLSDPVRHDSLSTYSTFEERKVAAARNNISSSAPDVPPMDADIESASLSHSTALSASHIACRYNTAQQVK